MTLLSSFFVIINLLLGLADKEAFEYEPMVYVKSLLQEPYTHQTKSWQAVKDLNHDPARRELVQNAIDDMLYSRAVLLLQEEHHTALNLPHGTQLNSTFSLPYPNILTLISISLDIFTNYVSSETFSRPLMDLDFAGEVIIPKNLQHSTILELLNKLPQYNYDQIGLVNELNIIGRTTFLVISDLLGKVSGESWYDAFLYLALDNAALTERQGIEVPLSDINSFIQSVLRQLKFINPVPIDKLPRVVRGNNYAFGWWLNCDGKLPCLINNLPRDAIISFSPAMRMYVIPSLEVGFVIANTAQISHNSRTFRDILNFDGEIFRRILDALKVQEEQTEEDNLPKDDNIENSEPSKKSIDPDTAPLFDSVDNSENTRSTSIDVGDGVLSSTLSYTKKYFLLYLEFTSRQNFVVRAMLWVIFLVIAHVIVYWGFHAVWFVLCLLVRRTHRPRPKIE